MYKIECVDGDVSLETPLKSPLTLNEWFWVIKKTYNVKPKFILMKEGDIIRGICFFYISTGILGEKVLRSLKEGFWISSNGLADCFLEEIIKYSEEQSVNEIILSAGLLKYDLSLNEKEKNTLLFHIGDSEESVWGNLRAKTRNSIRKAGKEGITIERGSRFLDDFYKGYSERLLDKEVSFHSKFFFEQMFNKFEENIELIVAIHEGKVIGSIIIIFNEKNAIYAYNGTNIHKPVSPNQLLLWEGVKSCITRGCSVLDLSESSEGSGVYKFKKNFGGIPTPTYYYTKKIKNHKGSFFARLRNKLITLSYDKLTLKNKSKISCWKRKFEVLQ